MLSGLDPRSVYLNESEYKALKAPAEAASPGLVLTVDNGQLKVVSPRDGSPAADAGIKPGDLIFTIDKEPTYDLTLPEIEQKLRGPEGSEVTLMLRRGTGAPIETKLKRAAVKLSTVTTRVESGDIAYVRIAGFDAQTAGALGDAVKQVKQQAGNKLLGFIVDLRNNPGGEFDAAVAAADASWTKATSPSSRTANPTTLSASPRPPAISPAGSRSSPLLMAARRARPSSSPALCRTATAPCCSAPRPSARRRSRR
jgi:carboxyl-terminal processing protease